MKLVTHSLLSLLVTGILFLQTDLRAAETLYVGDLKGVACTACKQKIAKSLAEIKGIKTIRLLKKSGKKYRLEVTTDGSVVITKAAVVNAIADADHYRASRWKKQ